MRNRIWFAFAVTLLPTWAITTVLCRFVEDSDDPWSEILFYLFWLPFGIAPLVGVLATIALGGRVRDYFPAVFAAVVVCWAWVFWLVASSDLTKCGVEMLVPSLLMSSAAVLAGAWATRA